MPKLDGGKIRQFLKKNILCNIFYYWHHKSPEKHHIELIEAIIVERFFFLVSVDHSDNLKIVMKLGIENAIHIELKVQKQYWH